MQAWQSYLIKRRTFLMAQMRYVATHNSRLEEVVGDERTDVSADWFDKTAAEYAEVTQLLIDAGLLTEAQADSEATR